MRLSASVTSLNSLGRKGREGNFSIKLHDAIFDAIPQRHWSILELEVERLRECHGAEPKHPGNATGVTDHVETRPETTSNVVVRVSRQIGLGALTIREYLQRLINWKKVNKVLKSLLGCFLCGEKDIAKFLHTFSPEFPKFAKSL